MNHGKSQRAKSICLKKLEGLSGAQKKEIIPVLNLNNIRSVLSDYDSYIEHRERALINRQSDIANNDSADAQNEKDKIIKQLNEIKSFKVKIDELLAEGYNPILDDGVGKNIAPLQKKKMIPYEVLNAGQLKKYLNADW